MESLPISSITVDQCPFGVNLQSVHDDKGAYVESFYRSKDGSKYEGERSESVEIGDRIYAIGQQMVYSLNLTQIHTVLSTHPHPITVQFLKVHDNIGISTIVHDPRLWPWINDYLKDYCSPHDTMIFSHKLNFLKYYRNFEWLYSSLRDNSSTCSCSEFSASINNDGESNAPANRDSDSFLTTVESVSFLVLSELLNAYGEPPFTSAFLTNWIASYAESDAKYDTETPGVCQQCRLKKVIVEMDRIAQLLTEELASGFIVKFTQCIAYKRMLGCMSDSVSAFHAFSWYDIICSEPIAITYYLYLTAIGRKCRLLEEFLVLMQMLQQGNRQCHSLHTKCSCDACAAAKSFISQRLLKQACNENELEIFYCSRHYQILLDHIIRVNGSCEIPTLASDWKQLPYREHHGFNKKSRSANDIFYIKRGYVQVLFRCLEMEGYLSKRIAIHKSPVLGTTATMLEKNSSIDNTDSNSSAIFSFDIKWTDSSMGAIATGAHTDVSSTVEEGVLCLDDEDSLLSPWSSTLKNRHTISFTKWAEIKDTVQQETGEAGSSVSSGNTVRWPRWMNNLSPVHLAQYAVPTDKIFLTATSTAPRPKDSLYNFVTSSKVGEQLYGATLIRYRKVESSMLMTIRNSNCSHVIGNNSSILDFTNRNTITDIDSGDRSPVLMEEMMQPQHNEENKIGNIFQAIPPLSQLLELSQTKAQSSSIKLSRWSTKVLQGLRTAISGTSIDEEGFNSTMHTTMSNNSMTQNYSNGERTLELVNQLASTGTNSDHHLASTSSTAAASEPTNASPVVRPVGAASIVTSCDNNYLASSDRPNQPEVGHTNPQTEQMDSSTEAAIEHVKYWVPYGVVIVSKKLAVKTLQHRLKEIVLMRSGDGGNEEPWNVDNLESFNTMEPLNKESNIDIEVGESETDIHYEAIYEAFSPFNLVKIFFSFLLECQIVVTSRCHLSLVVSLGEWLRLAITPARWCHIYAPVLSQESAQELIQCPAPFFVGLLRSSLCSNYCKSCETNELLREVLKRQGKVGEAAKDGLVVLVDFDNDKVNATERVDNFLNAALNMDMGRHLIRNIEKILRPNLFHSVDTISYKAIDTNTYHSSIEACQIFTQWALSRFDRYTISFLEENELVVILNEELLIKEYCGETGNTKQDSKQPKIIKNCRNSKTFFKMLFRTQCFSQALLHHEAAILDIVIAQCG